MRHTGKVTLEIKMKKFYTIAIPKVSKKALHKAIKNELYQSCMGIIHGDYGGTATDWEREVYRELYDSGIIDFTKFGEKLYKDLIFNK